MSSINTNASAMTALQTLAQTNKNLATTQSRISTGYRVAEASDNAAYWSIATTMRSDNKALSTVQDSLGLGASRIDTAYTGMNSAIEVVDEIKQKLVSSLGASADDKGKIQTEVDQLKEQLLSIANSANFAGTNLLVAATPADLSIVSSYDRAADGTTTVNTIDVSVTDVTLFTDGDAGTGGTLGAVYAITGLDTSNDAAIEAFIGTVETALGTMTDGAATLGAAKKRVDIQKDFTSKLMDAIDRGVGQMVDADMTKESARLSALQTQQQLGIQALSIANSNSQNILSLFR
jgi:flagellin